MAWLREASTASPSAAAGGRWIGRSPAASRGRRTRADQAAKKFPARRHADRAQHRAAVAHQADVDGEIVAPGGELLGAVQRIDQPEAVGARRDDPGGHLLLGDHRQVGGRRPQAAHDQRLGGAVRLGDGGGVGLALGREAAAHGWPG